MFLNTPQHNGSSALLNRIKHLICSFRAGKRKEGGEGRGGEQYLRIVYINDCCKGSCNKSTAHH